MRGCLALPCGAGVATMTIGTAHPALAHYSAPTACGWPTSETITASGASNQIVDLPYSDGIYVQARLVLNVDDKEGILLNQVFDDGIALTGNDTIVTNLSNTFATVTLALGESDGIAKSLSPRKATIARGLTKVIKASSAETPSGGDTSGPLHLAFIRTSSPRNFANALNNKSIWQSYSAADCWPEGVGPYPLWMSTRAQLQGLKLSFDPWKISNQKTPSGKGARQFNIHTNLWWIPAMSDAAVHHCHYEDFVEVHTQLMGVGRMQKFTDSVVRKTCPSPEIFDMSVTPPVPSGSYYGVPGVSGLDLAFPAMYEEYRLSPGDTNVPFAYVDEQEKFIYPWHQYYADTDCLWVVWEMVPTS